MYGQQPMYGQQSMYGGQPGMMGGGMMGGGMMGGHPGMYGQQGMMMGRPQRQGMGAGGAVSGFFDTSAFRLPQFDTLHTLSLHVLLDTDVVFVPFRSVLTLGCPRCWWWSAWWYDDW